MILTGIPSVATSAVDATVWLQVFVQLYEELAIAPLAPVLAVIVTRASVSQSTQ